MNASPDEDTVLTHLFVLRLWRERASTPWRAARRPADGTSPIGFAHLHQLAAFVLRLAERPAASTTLGQRTTLSMYLLCGLIPTQSKQSSASRKDQRHA